MGIGDNVANGSEIVKRDVEQEGKKNKSTLFLHAAWELDFEAATSSSRMPVKFVGELVSIKCPSKSIKRI